MVRIGFLAALLTVLAIPQEAEACGGTFCDAGQPMAVDQTGENILFVMGEGWTEAHIQIQYDPESEAENFAWIVPLLAVPEFSVGSERLLQNMLDGTVPAYGFNTNSSCGGSATATSGFGSSGGGGGSSTGGEPEGPEVILNEVVGAFEVNVLEGGTAEQVANWLDMNGYQQEPEAVPILEEYLAEGFMFAAFKLTNDAEVAEIHPVTLRFETTEACVPLRLTRIAAQDDMDVRALFLADNRVVPSTYRHVLVNPLKIDWVNRADNYKQLITLAVDADEANGRAFVTEYAGPSSVVSDLGIFSPSWDASVFEMLDAVDVVDQLDAQGLMYCGGGSFGTTSTGADGTSCSYQHTLLRGLLAAYLPVPAGVDEVDFYGCLSCYEGQIDAAAWDGAAFAADMQERIIDPGQHAVEMLDAFPTLSRMYTTISPHEMIEDPLFYQNADLQEIDLRNEVASRDALCDGDEIWTLPDGRQVYVPDGVWPDFPDEMPWEEEVEDMPPAGAPISVVDNRDLIAEQLAMHNCQFNFPSPEACVGVGGDTDGQATGGDGQESGGDTDGGTSGGPGATPAGSGGCGCSSTQPPGWAVLAFPFLVLGWARGRRRVHDYNEKA